MTLKCITYAQQRNVIFFVKKNAFYLEINKEFMLGLIRSSCCYNCCDSVPVLVPTTYFFLSQLNNILVQFDSLQMDIKYNEIYMD